MMNSFRFTDERQKTVHMAVLRDLLLENQGDQITKTVLSNAIAVSEGTMVAGDLDELIHQTDRWYRKHTRLLSVFFVALAVFEFGFAYVEWRNHGPIAALGPIFFGLAVLGYCWALQQMWRIQRRYHGALKHLEELQLELPATPFLRDMSRSNNG